MSWCRPPCEGESGATVTRVWVAKGGVLEESEDAVIEVEAVGVMEVEERERVDDLRV